MNDGLNFVADVFTSLFMFQEKVFDALGVWGVLFAVFFVFTTARLLIMPIVGGFISAGTSDVVHRVNKTGRHASRPSPKSNGKKG